MQTDVIPDTAAMELFATRVAERLTPGVGATLLALSGDLGAGKTTFTQGLARALGVTESVSSPTFVVMRRYPLHTSHFRALVHIDAYRIEDESELLPLRLDELLKEHCTLVVLEWPERVPSLSPYITATLTFAHGEAGARTVTYELPHANN